VSVNNSEISKNVTTSIARGYEPYDPPILKSMTEVEYGDLAL
jgi:hypothetical protein